MSTSVSVQDEAALTAAIADVRNDATATNWVLAGHADLSPNVIKLIGSGSGGYEELKSHLDNSNVMYGLVRASLTFDMSTTVKFCYINFIGPDVPVNIRGKIGVVHGSVKAFFNPFHIDFELSSTDEISSEDIDRKLAETSGRIDKSSDISHDGLRHERGFTSSNVSNVGQTRKSNFGFQGNAASTRSSMGIVFDEALLSAIKDVRDDATETSWVIGTYQDGDMKKPVTLVASGVGEAEDLAKAITAHDAIYYALLRVIDVIDGHKTTKFVYIYFLGSEVSIMKKAKVATHKGDVEGTFGPFHVSYEISMPNELTTTAVMNKVQAASGSKSFVKG